MRGGQDETHSYPCDHVSPDYRRLDDRLSVLSAGVMEVVFGTILALGVVTRLDILAVAALMLTSNIVFLIEGRNEEALVELIGQGQSVVTVSLHANDQADLVLNGKPIAAEVLVMNPASAETANHRTSTNTHSNQSIQTKG